MKGVEQNKSFIFQYYHAISGRPKPRKLLEQFIADPSLINYILTVEHILPSYADTIDEMTGEQDRIIVRSTLSGKSVTDDHHGGIQSRLIEFPVAIGYFIVNKKIVDHWMISDHLSMLEQLGWLPEFEIDFSPNHKSK